MIKDLANLYILKSGPGTSIQDFGRIGFGQFGVPISGAMDTQSMKWVNHLLQNNENEAVLEISQPGLLLKFEAPTVICLGGAKADAFLNGNPVSSEGLLKIDFGDLIEIKSFKIGTRLYLGIKHGFRVPTIMESKSGYHGISDFGNVKKGDEIGYFSNLENPTISHAKVKFERKWMMSNEILAYPGPEWNELKSESQTQILSTKFTVSTMVNRMAYQLEELIPNSLEEMATASVYPGTVQLTSGGKMIILMKDAQVTGGYPRILQLPEESINLLAQKKSGDQIIFKH